MGAVVQVVDKASGLTVVWAADLEPADAGEHSEVGQTAQAEQNATEGIDYTGGSVKQPPGRRVEETEEIVFALDFDI